MTLWILSSRITNFILTRAKVFLRLFKPKVKAYDADTPPYNDQVRYFLKEGDTDLFRINASTGDISLLRPLDRELVPEYTLTLVAMDTGELLHYLLTPNRVQKRKNCIVMTQKL